LLDENGIGVLMFLEEKIEGRKVQFLPFLLSKNMRKYTLKNTGFCPNKVIHFISYYFSLRSIDKFIYITYLLSFLYE